MTRCILFKILIYIPIRKLDDHGFESETRGKLHHSQTPALNPRLSGPSFTKIHVSVSKFDITKPCSIVEANINVISLPSIWAVSFFIKKVSNLQPFYLLKLDTLTLP